MITLDASRGFGTWLRDREVTLIVSAYQSGRLFAIGSDPSGSVTFSTVTFDRCMGLAAESSGFWLATLNRLWRYAIFHLGRDKPGSHDAFLVPQTSHHTGYVNAHDVAVDQDARPLIVASQFNCLMRVTGKGVLSPVWLAPFVDELVAEDRVHLNGLAISDGEAKLATALSRANVGASWRQDPNDGCVIDIASGVPVAGGLCMPHSPRLHLGRTWLHQSGTGGFGYLEGNRFVEIAFCSGYPRGLQFIDRVAVVGVSKKRDAAGCDALPLAARLAAASSESRCGVLLIDIDTGKALHTIRFGRGIDEIYDVAVVPGVCHPKLLNPTDPELSNIILLGRPK